MRNMFRIRENEKSIRFVEKCHHNFCSIRVANKNVLFNTSKSKYENIRNFFAEVFAKIDRFELFMGKLYDERDMIKRFKVCIFYYHNKSTTLLNHRISLVYMAIFIRHK